MKLSALLSRAAVPAGAIASDPEIGGISEDSRTVGKNFLFFARKGVKTSGFEFLEAALKNGAVAVISEEEPRKTAPQVPWVRVPSIAESQPRIASAFYENPSRSLAMIGVTGTNGKTTFTYLLESIAREAGLKPGVIGTISYRLPLAGSDGVETLPAPNTTPNALELQKILHQMKERKSDLAAMEVSSHALALGRTGGIEFDGAVFTNLTQDHLDFHHTMENYFEAKAKLFESMGGMPKAMNGKIRPFPKFCVINADDEYGPKMLKRCAAPAVTYGVRNASDFRAVNVSLEPSQTLFEIERSGKRVPLKMNLVGMHNVYNALSAFAAADRMGLSQEAIVRGLEKMDNIPGRLESVKCGQDFTVLVDYAHTEDALKNVLQALQAIKKNRILTLFGCGGDRDRSKRPLMGACAVTLSDQVIVTSDNPRSEDPHEIALDIEVGIHRTQKTNYEVILDREKAIQKILGLAQKDDIVLIAGKGHETYQIFSDRTIHFDDREAAKKFLCSR